MFPVEKDLYLQNPKSPRSRYVQSPGFTCQWVKIGIRIKGVILLHDSYVVPHLLLLLRGEGWKWGTFLFPILRRPLCKFSSLPIVFRGIGVWFPRRIDHGFAAEPKVGNLVDMCITAQNGQWMWGTKAAWIEFNEYIPVYWEANFQNLPWRWFP